MSTHEPPKPDPNMPGIVRRKALRLSGESLIKTEDLRPGVTLPLVVRPAIEGINLVAWAANNRQYIETQLLEHGVILFRGFDTHSVSAFENFASAICPELFGQYGDLPRENESGKVYHSTPYPPNQTIFFHNEASHTYRWPMKIWFFCKQAAQQGGETPIADCRKVYGLIDPEIRERFERKKVMYVRNFGGGLDVSWQAFFQTSDRRAVEEYCRNSSIDFAWKGEDGLKIREVRAAIAEHPKTGQMVWFNQLLLHHTSSLDREIREFLLSAFKEEDLPRNVYYGDGSPIEDAVTEKISAAYRETATSFPWRDSDILMLDNMLTAHSRNPFTGTRKILVAMGEMMTGKDLATAARA